MSDDKTVIRKPNRTLRDRYVLEELLGVGGMGEVYKALDKYRQEAGDKEPHVAIKLISKAFGEGQIADPLVAMQREASKSQKLRHRNIIAVHDFDRTDDEVFMVMELLEGQSLREFIDAQDGGGLPLQAALPIIKQIGDGLSYAHEHDIVHSDIKPANIYLTESMDVKLLDFGIAQAAASANDQQDKTLFNPRAAGAVTPAYASAQAILGSHPEAKDDVYSLGCVIYELLTGKHPYGRKSGYEVLTGKLQLSRGDGLSDRQWKVLEQALHPDSESRLGSVQALVNAFDNEAESSSEGNGSKLPLLLSGAAVVVAAAGIAFFLNKTPVEPVAVAPVVEVPAPAVVEEVVTPPPEVAFAEPAAPVPVEPEPERTVPDLTVSLVTPNAQKGDALTFEVKAETQGVINCYYDDSQAVMRVFPNRFRSNNALVPGQVLMIPGEGDRFDIALEDPTRTEALACILTSEDPVGSGNPYVATDLESLGDVTLDQVKSSFREMNTVLGVNQVLVGGAG